MICWYILTIFEQDISWSRDTLKPSAPDDSTTTPKLVPFTSNDRCWWLTARTWPASTRTSATRTGFLVQQFILDRLWTKSVKNMFFFPDVVLGVWGESTGNHRKPTNRMVMVKLQISYRFPLKHGEHIVSSRFFPWKQSSEPSDSYEFSRSCWGNWCTMRTPWVWRWSWMCCLDLWETMGLGLGWEGLGWLGWTQILVTFPIKYRQSGWSQLWTCPPVHLSMFLRSAAYIIPKPQED